ncbi:CBS domain-containing protein [Pseudoalteromonas sp. YIC-656]|uniref:CBS domain-containing protein n=1 Tax=Pseudoalteromonas pernae TaxID=3118054 RepID=UPI003241E966
MHLSTAANIMTTDLVTIAPDATLHQAHEVMREHNIRHIPVVGEDQQLLGMLTQKVMIAQVMKIISVFGASALERKEKQTLVSEIMSTDFDSVAPQEPLIDIAKFFLTNRHGCMPVVSDDKLVGLLTSSDFVRLCVSLMEKS